MALETINHIHLSCTTNLDFTIKMLGKIKSILSCEEMHCKLKR